MRGRQARLGAHHDLMPGVAQTHVAERQVQRFVRGRGAGQRGKAGLERNLMIGDVAKGEQLVTAGLALEAGH